MSTDLPPEAFTKKTLQDAFNWLQDQPEPVKASVHTPERLISLYQTAQRRLEDQDAPVSSKKFIDDLKNLASSLDQFNQAPAPVPVPFQSQAPEVSAGVQFHEPQRFHQPEPTRYHAPEPTRFHSPAPQDVPSGRIETVKTETETHRASVEFTHQKQQTTTETIYLDSTSRDRIKTVRERFNLGSDHEALRLLVSLGFEKFSQFP